jgi:ABC-type multidrug transport system ATPase subunit
MMNEMVLKSLMRLFAIVADVQKDGNFENKRDIVVDYLDRQYSQELVEAYIEYFDEQVKLLHPEVMYTSETELNLQNKRFEDLILETCERINQELEMEQKMIVLVYLLDFINRGDKITFREQKYVFKIAVNLKINLEEFKDLRSFSFGKIDKIINKSRLLFIDSKDSPEQKEIKHMYNPKMEGQIVVLYLPYTNLFVFRYNGSLNFLLNGHRIKPYRSYIWSVGAVLKNAKVGSLYYTRMVGRFIQDNVEKKFVYVAEEIEYRYGSSNNGVRRFTLNEESGRFIGIIGGSGSGKSTLLNLLCGNLKPRHGKITVNGWDIHEHNEELKGVIGFVPQDDLLIKELTVYQNLYYNAKLSFGDYTESQIQQVVERALIDFDLVEARDLNVGDAFTTVLSGGQRKRLNIALELIREPSILFVDEPTSGLSSADSEKVINLLKRQTFKGNLIIATIHQPSSDIFKMFDKLLVMDQGGRIIYYGNPIDGITYFKKIVHFADAEESECLCCGNINCDQILRTVEARVVDAYGRPTRKRKISPQEWYELYLKNIDPDIRQIQREHDGTVPKNNFKIPNRLKQFSIFLRRDVFAKIRNQQYMLLSALEAPILALIIAFFSKRFIFNNGIAQYIFSENTNIPSYLFMIVVVALFLGSIISAEEIFKDRKILRREKFLNLSRSSYLFSKIVILFTISAIQMLLLVIIGNSILHVDNMTWRYWLVLFSTSCCANLIGLNISAGLNSVVTIYILIPIILVPQLLFSGVVIEFDKMHNKEASDLKVPIQGDLTTSRWAFEALSVTQFKDNPYEINFYPFEQLQYSANYYRSSSIPYLRNLLDNIQDSVQKKNMTVSSPQLQDDIATINNELVNIAQYLNIKLPKTINLSRKEKIVSLNDITTQYLSDVSRFIDQVEGQLNYQYSYAIQKRDSTFDALVKKYGSRDNVVKFKQRYYNKQLSDIVTNEKELMDFYVFNNQIIPVRNAIYRLPNSPDGRAHFYAPAKKLGKYYIDTFWFNILVIWLSTAILFVILYFDLLRKVIAYFESLRLSRLARRRFMRLLNISEQIPVRK